jgi:hypothetical protein
MTMRLLLVILALLAGLASAPAGAREGDTLLPIQIDAPALETYPDDLLAENDFRAIESRVIEARNAGVPVAIRIVDMTQPAADMPFPVRKYARDDFSQPMSVERQQAITGAWFDHESIESSNSANDGFVLLVLVPEDRMHTQAIWGIGPNALPLNGLTQGNILATHNVMDAQFAGGNMPNGVYLGISEFSYNVQFGVPDRVERTTNQNALYTAVIPLAIGTAVAGLFVPALAWRLSRRKGDPGDIDGTLTPWQAAAIHRKRATPAITAAMLLDAVHRRSLTPGRDGSVQLSPEPGNAAIEALRPFANPDGVVPAEAMLEVNAITAPVRDRIENDLATRGAMTSRVYVDRMWMLVAMGFALGMAALTVVPTVVSMSVWGVFGIAMAVLGLVIGWWWLTHRSYATPAGEALLERWLAEASPEERHLFDSATNLRMLTDQIGGPEVNPQTRLVRQLRGLGAG